jgi:hypothetical protein
MKRGLIYLLLLGFILGVSGRAMAASSVNQTVTIAVGAINEISVTGSPSLTVNTATAGSQPTEATDGSTTYNITTNGTNMKITGALSPALPGGVTLKINLASVGGTSSGDVTLGTSPLSLVTGITQKVESLDVITYKLDALVSAGVVPSTTETVTLTIASGP